MKIKHFLQLIRYRNLLMLVFIQLLFIRFINLNIGINNPNAMFTNFILLTLSIILITASGNIINDYFDIEVDKINKPNDVIVTKYISKKNTLILYHILNFLGILLGTLLSLRTNNKWYSLIFIVTVIVLYLYSSYFKKIALFGNFIVSALISISILLVYIFNNSRMGFEKRNPILIYFIIYSLLAFIINFIRELLKDIEDIDGDHSQNLKTLPILIGRKRTQQILFYMAIIPFFGIILLISASKLLTLQIYSFAFIIIPLGYFMYKIKGNESKTEIHKLSTLLKIIMLFGMLSVLFLG